MKLYYRYGKRRNMYSMQKFLENVYHVIQLPVDFHLYIPLDMRIRGEVQLPEIVLLLIHSV